MKAKLGTAGHIDHGKSALVRALSGIETDRLPEERDRGISIELGFAHVDLGDGEDVGIVDVPGHERFIRQMLAGAHGFDLVLVVVAADDGVMPQTEEHFEIVNLLDVRQAVFVVTKADLAASDRIVEVEEEIAILAAGTHFEDAPVAVVSATTGTGIQQLRELLAAELAHLQTRRDDGPLRLPVDRVFVMKGHGTVVTGTAVSGSVVSGDEVEIMPSGTTARVRDVQVHGVTVDRARAGQRVALNLSGVDKASVSRGDTVAAPGLALVTERFDACIQVRPLAGGPVDSHAGVRVYIGTQEVAGRIAWLDGRASVAPRETGYAQVRLLEPAVACSGDHIVLRDETASRTLGGGRILVARSQRHRKSAGPVIPRLQRIEGGDAAERILAFLEIAPGLGMPPPEVAQAAAVDQATLAALVDAEEAIVGIPEGKTPQLLVARARLSNYQQDLAAAVAQFHSANHELAGMELEHLRKAVTPLVDGRTFRPVVEAVIAAGLLVRQGSVIHLPGHTATIADGDRDLAERLLRMVVEGAAMPPVLKQLETELKVTTKRLAAVVGVLVERGELVRVSPELVYGRDALREIEQAVRQRLAADGEMSAGEFRDLIAASRKYCIPLLDYFDRNGVTVRVGDLRKLRSP